MADNIIKGLERSARAVKAYLEAEIVEDGLLEDLETLLTSHKSETPADPPCIWIVEYPTVPYDPTQTNLSHTLYLKSPFEFVCVEYDNDPEIAAEKAKNLATRAGASILKNFNLLKSQPDDPNRIFQTIHFNTLNPDGEVQIEGKAERIPAASLILDFIHPIQWMHCNRI
jgi:hypothetical protein